MIKIGINGFGRIGRLAMRATYQWDDVQVVQINDPTGNNEVLAHLLNFDSVHGHWEHRATHTPSSIIVDSDQPNSHEIAVSHNTQINDTNWSNCDVVIESSGKFKNVTLLNAYLEQGVDRVVVSAPIKDSDILNIVVGVNDHLYDSERHLIVTAASCTTNCLAPIVKVIHENLNIKHGSITTIHDITNTQSILDSPHNDLRRARASSMSLIPTSTGSATAIAHIFPELKGKLNGHAVRVPLANASLTDCVFEVEQATDIEQVNQLFRQASETNLNGILGYEEQPLVSIDYRSDPRSTIIDALSTMVINETQIKIYAWYDNEWGYANRTVDVVRMIG